MLSENAYLPAILAAAIVSGMVYAAALNRRGHPPAIVLITPAMAILFGLIGARLFYFGARAGFLVPMYGWRALVSLPSDQLAFGGAVTGAILGARLAEKTLQAGKYALLDALAAPGAIMVLLARLAEYTVSFGQGAYVESPAQQFFPLAVKNEWGEWYYAIFMLEAVVAGLAILYALRARKTPAGRVFKLTLASLMLAQILTESLRAESLKWGFVRVHQLYAVLLLALIMISFVVRARKQGHRVIALITRQGLPFLFGVVLLVGIEFALDKWEVVANWLLYLAMIGVLLGMGTLVYRLEATTRR